MRHLRPRIETLVTVGLLAVLAVSPAYAQPGFNPPGLDVAIAAQERHTDNLLGIQGVVGTAVGLGAAGQPVVKIYTETPGVAGLPRFVDGVPVVVQVTGKIFALHHCKGSHFDPDVCGAPPGGGGPPAPDPEEPVDPTARFPRPVPIGVSTGHPDITAGTIGARVKDAFGVVYALSNNHVYADLNNAVLDDPVLQPGTFDGGSPDPDLATGEDDIIGTLEAFVDVKFPAANCNPSDPLDSDCNTVDAAIALSSTENLGNATPSDGYGTPKSATVSATINQNVKKYGRTTSLTEGFINAINATVDVCYEVQADGTTCVVGKLARFVDQIVVFGLDGGFIATFSRGGDSGSLVVTSGGSPVGLLFAGGSVFVPGDFAILNPIDLVLSSFAVTIDGKKGGGRKK